MKRNGRRGSTMLEFVLAGIFVLVPLTLGATTVGMTLARSIHVFEFNRNAGRLFSRGVDFSQPSNRALLLRLANGLNIADQGGDGVVILTGVLCTPTGQAVATRRYVIGNASLRSSSYANPTKIDENGTVDYEHDGGANLNSLLTALPMSPGETAYLVETYYSSAEYDWAGFLQGKGIYTMGVF